MFKLIIKTIQIPHIKNLLNRIINRYTSSGVIIVLMQLESLEIIPRGVTEAVEGLPAREILIYLTLAVGIYLIIHKPNVISKTGKERRTRNKK